MPRSSTEYFDHLYQRHELIRKQYDDKYVCGIFMSMIVGRINKGLCLDTASIETEKTKDSIKKMASEIGEINERCQPNQNQHQQKEK